MILEGFRKILGLQKKFRFFESCMVALPLKEGCKQGLNF